MTTLGATVRQSQLETPVLLCVFNRPKATQRVLATIARQRPRLLLVVGDGPRTGVPGDAAAVVGVRNLLTRIDWPCEVRTLFSDSNLGCRQRMASGITWAFTQSERLIVLEDDCLPHDDFFPFCERLLDRYADEPAVTSIAGSNFQPGRRTPYNHYFSRYAHIWGWASWRRAWQHYDVAMRDWPAYRDGNFLHDVLEDPEEIAYWTRLFDGVHGSKTGTWDFQWLFTCWRLGGLTAIPEVNLVSNIGFGDDSMHTKNAASPLAELPTASLGAAPEPPAIDRLVEADTWTWQRVFAPSSAKTGKLARLRLRFRERGRRLLQKIRLNWLDARSGRVAG